MNPDLFIIFRTKMLLLTVINAIKGGAMKTSIDSITVEGKEYVPKDSIKKMAVEADGKKYQIVRTYSAGVFAGYIEKRNGQEVVMVNARRLYYWDGASTLSQLAMEGVKKPQNCKFPCEVERVELLQVIEILDCTEEAKNSILGVAIWKQ